MKSRIITDTFAWLICFLMLSFYLPSTRWWAAEGFPQNLNFETMFVATLGAIAWVALRAFSCRQEIQNRWRLSLGIALISPVATWIIGYGVAWLTFSALAVIGRLLHFGQSPSFTYVPRMFTLMPLILAGYGWGLTSELIFHSRDTWKTDAQST